MRQSGRIMIIILAWSLLFGWCLLSSVWKPPGHAGQGKKLGVSTEHWASLSSPLGHSRSCEEDWVEMRENTESPVHVYQEIDTVDYDVVKSDQGDQLELEWFIFLPFSLPTYWLGEGSICHGMEWIVDVLI